MTLTPPLNQNPEQLARERNPRSREVFNRPHSMREWLSQPVRARAGWQGPDAQGTGMNSLRRHTATASRASSPLQGVRPPCEVRPCPRNTQRISLRERIFREVVANLLIHREYLNPFPAKLVIQRDRVTTENSNNPHGMGLLRPDDFVPSPKNPAIARVFREMQWAEELGSGVRNLFKYARAFGGQDPILSEASIFRVTVMLPILGTAAQPEPEAESATQSPTQSSAQVERLLRVLATQGSASAAQLRHLLDIRHRPTFRQNYLDPALAAGLIEYTLPAKPNSRLQQYRLTPAGQAHLHQQDTSS